MQYSIEHNYGLYMFLAVQVFQSIYIWQAGFAPSTCAGQTKAGDEDIVKIGRP